MCSSDLRPRSSWVFKMQKMGSTNTQIILNTQLDRGLAFDE